MAPSVRVVPHTVALVGPAVMMCWDRSFDGAGYSHRVTQRGTPQGSSQLRFRYCHRVLVSGVGAILVTMNTRDMVRVNQIFAFQYVAPYPELS
jgi:hypothetical protein